MAKDYPHLNDTVFPDADTIDVYKYRNEFDYSKYRPTVKITMLSVPWRSDYDNVVYFESKAERDSWFASHAGRKIEMDTPFRLYTGGTLPVPVPIDEAMAYNYCMVDYGTLPTQQNPTGNERMFYFIMDMRQSAPDTTELVLAIDYWTTYINDLGISYVELERGHAPMASITTEQYLSNPVENNSGLLAPDVSYGDFSRVQSTEPIILNDEMGGVTVGFLTNASMQESWSDGDTGYDRIPTYPWELSQAFSCIDTFVLDDVSSWYDFRDNVSEQCPQFWLTVKGMFIVPKKAITLSNTWEFCGIECHHVETQGDKIISQFEIDKDKFGYPEQFSEIAKLYTYPYSAIEVNDFKGGSTIIRVEDTCGTLELHTIMCDMYPFLNIEAYFTGIGASGKATVGFFNSYENRFTIGGRDYEFSTKWSIPVFAVQLSVAQNWELNGKISADTTLANAYADAANYIAVASIENGLRTDLTDRSNSFIHDSIKKQAITAFNDGESDILYARANLQNHLFYDTAASIVNGASNVAGSMAGGNMGGAVISAVSSPVSYALTAYKDADGETIQEAYITGKIRRHYGDTESETWSQDGLDVVIGQYQRSMNSDKTEYTNDSIHNSSGTGTVDITSAKEIANAERSYAASHEQRYITNPPEFGQLTGTPDIISKPFGVRASIITQSASAIAQAGEQFLRYGYAYGREWKVNTFNVMPKFSYWQCSRVTSTNVRSYEAARDVVYSILANGVTVWKDPAFIGTTSIYENRGENQ